jgi:hypothetical protein
MLDRLNNTKQKKCFPRSPTNKLAYHQRGFRAPSIFKHLEPAFIGKHHPLPIVDGPTGVISREPRKKPLKTETIIRRAFFLAKVVSYILEQLNYRFKTWKISDQFL